MSDEPAILTMRPTVDDYIALGPIIEIKPANNIIVKCGEGKVIIDFETGKVTFENCEPDAGAKAFWDGVSMYAQAAIERVVEGRINAKPQQDVFKEEGPHG